MKSILVPALSLASLAWAAKPKPLVTPDALQDLIKLDDLLEGSQQLQDFAYAYPDRNRVFGGKAHNDTVNWLYRELKRTGYYDVYRQPQVHLYTNAEQSLTVNGEAIEAQTMTYSPSANATGAELAVISGLGCGPADFPADVAGKVALIQRGNCTFGEKSVYAAAAGASAAIVYNNVEGTVSGTLGAAQSELGPYAGIVGITLADGEALIALTEAGPVTVDLWIESVMENRTTYNVIAQTKGGDPNNVVSLGGHSDSVEAGPGINDDGSGIISNLIIARALTQFSTKHAVRFCFWTAEEFGLLGSEYYVSSLSPAELAKIRLYLNFDMIASPNYGLLLYDGDGSAFNLTGPAGSDAIEKLFYDYFQSVGQATMETEFDGRSDYEAFILNGIPAGGVFTGAEGVKTEEEVALWGGEAGIAYDENYHQVGDTFDNLNTEAYLMNSKATAFAVATYANDLSTIPKTNVTTVVKRSDVNGHMHRRTMPKKRQTVHRHSAKGCFHSREAL
ncbi:M28 family metallopeptidase [Aspergillus mulundensis]|uniref:Peptide hydrolase n=1 Tax=Aspergillus mulundensis TaxID=1810919 RepID=A0A3D8R4I8_9EURO|nr:Peptide hydrolase [Aspergillus mulundensis]RDW68841.1 Peptide hydrolase [Aspergillus mulundensis]